MSTYLDDALQEIADAAGRASRLAAPDDTDAVAVVQRITARVRRRRALHAGAGAAAAAGAVGAVGLGAGLLAPGPSLPAARPDAAPGTCGSDVGRLPAADGTVETMVGVPSGDGLAAFTSGSHLGTWGGSETPLTLTDVVQGDDVHTLPTDTRALLVRDDVVVSTSTLTSDLRTVVPGAPLGQDDEETRWGTDGSQLSLGRCDDGRRLPEGDYDLWVLHLRSGEPTRADGPWTITVGERLARIPGPAGFPQDVPLVGGTITSVQEGTATTSTGWVVEVEAPGDDRLSVAAAVLDDDTTAAGAPVTGPLTRTIGEHVVTVWQSTLPDGVPSLVYRVVPLEVAG